jgi:putative flippase GtrA
MSLRTFGRATLVSIFATAVEFAVLPLLVYVASVPRPIAYAAVQILANIVTFTLYKLWAFDARHVGSTKIQFLRQCVVFGGSWVLNTILPTVLSLYGVEAVLSFALSNVVVYLAWNYPCNRFWVFREAAPQHPR